MGINTQPGQAGIEYWRLKIEDLGIYEILIQKRLFQQFDFYIWRRIDENHSAIRIITSWATKEEHVGIFIEEIKKL